jgi:hypothetical protein
MMATKGAGTNRHADWVGLVKPGASIPFDSIRDPGAYICNWSGHLLRVPQQALVPNGVMNIVAAEPLYVTKICDDPDVPLSQAREAASQYNVPVGF